MRKRSRAHTPVSYSVTKLQHCRKLFNTVVIGQCIPNFNGKGAGKRHLRPLLASIVNSDYGSVPPT
jgi:hypothetical protein